MYWFGCFVKIYLTEKPHSLLSKLLIFLWHSENSVPALFGSWLLIIAVHPTYISICRIWSMNITLHKTKDLDCKEFSGLFLVYPFPLLVFGLSFLLTSNDQGGTNIHDANQASIVTSGISTYFNVQIIWWLYRWQSSHVPSLQMIIWAYIHRLWLAPCWLWFICKSKQEWVHALSIRKRTLVCSRIVWRLDLELDLLEGY